MSGMEKEGHNVRSVAKTVETLGHLRRLICSLLVGHEGPLHKGCRLTAMVSSRRVAKSFDGAASGGGHGTRRLAYMRTTSHGTDTLMSGEAGHRRQSLPQYSAHPAPKHGAPQPLGEGSNKFKPWRSVSEGHKWCHGSCDCFGGGQQEVRLHKD